jgi:hypothetical protein
MLHLTELSIDSHAHKQAPDMPPRAYSHVDNEGVKALVDSICTRMRMRGGEWGHSVGIDAGQSRRTESCFANGMADATLWNC